jgi:hypothetical protein
VVRLREAFTSASGRAWFRDLADPLLLEGFEAVTADTFTSLLDWDREARAAGFERPA